ncbi:MAG: 30S ribosome-binding factor RbfA [Candidatus Hydrogenedentes bacterium]|nr:30S ribosome-binding factor RbfA [Candidatus Hydrogenedentota bacterium]
MASESRALRVAEVVRAEIAQLLSKGLKDPRVGFVSIMAVKMSPDLRYANVYVSLYGSEKETKASLIGLRNSAGWIRRELGRRLKLRLTPEVRFFEDMTLDKVFHLEEVLKDLKDSEEQERMNLIDLKGVVEECRGADSFLVTTHSNPDGDAIGSLLAMRHFLNALAKEDVTCACHDPAPRIYDWLPGATEIVNADNLRATYDLVVVLDVAQLDRIGSVALRLSPEQRILVLDHHREENPCGTVNFIDHTYASASEIVTELFDASGLPISREAAECAYVGLTTDTGSFKYANTDARAHRCAARLLETGIDVSDISSRVFDVMSLPKRDLLRRVLERLQVSDCARYAWSYLTGQDMIEAGAMSEDVDGLVNFVRNLEGVEVGMLFRELERNRLKVSMRSRGRLNAADVLRPLGGGGHAGAAGATLHLPMEEGRARVLQAVEEALGAIYS